MMIHTHGIRLYRVAICQLVASTPLLPGGVFGVAPGALLDITLVSVVTKR